MAVEYRALAALSIAFIASIIAYPHLPPQIPPLWRIDGEWVFIGAPFVAFLLPVSAAVIWWLLASLNQGSSSTRRAGGAGAVTVLFLSAFHVTMLIGFIGALPWLGRILGVIVGAFLIVTGNELPRVRPNPAWGIHGHPPLGRDPVWRRVQRLGGYVRVAMGLAVCVASLWGMPGIPQLIVVAVLVEAVVCVLALMFLPRQNRAAIV
jgi:uncharacterized membrane protein